MIRDIEKIACMGFDAFRILEGIEPRNYSARQIADALCTTRPAATSQSIEGKMRSDIGPEDFGVPGEFEQAARNYGNWLAATSNEAAPDSENLYGAGIKTWRQMAWEDGCEKDVEPNPKFYTDEMQEEISNLRAALANKSSSAALAAPPAPTGEAVQPDAAVVGGLSSGQVEAIHALGRDDPAVHAFLTLKRRDSLSWGDVLAQMVLHLARDKEALTAKLIKAAELRPAAVPAATPALLGLTRYGWTEAYLGESSDLIEDPNGTYVKYADVIAALKEPKP